MAVRGAQVNGLKLADAIARPSPNPLLEQGRKIPSPMQDADYFNTSLHGTIEYDIVPHRKTPQPVSQFLAPAPHVWHGCQSGKSGNKFAEKAGCRMGIILRDEEPDIFQIRARSVGNPILAHVGGFFRLFFNRCLPDLLTSSAKCITLVSSYAR